MSLFVVDKSKCRKDGICVAVCPIKIIAVDESNLPMPVKDAKELCINCGHCVAVCPHEAISLTTMPCDECDPVLNEKISSKQAEYFLKQRRSIRVYKKKTVNKDIIKKIFDTAGFAPSGLNRQSVHWIVITDPDKVQVLAGLVIDWMRSLIEKEDPLAQILHMPDFITAWDKGKDLICRGAPHLVIAYGITDDFTVNQASTIALTYFDLAATSFDLGTCWAGYVHMAVNTDQAIRKFIGMSQRCNCFGAMLFGYPEFKYQRIPKRNEPRIKWK